MSNTFMVLVRPCINNNSLLIGEDSFWRMTNDEKISVGDFVVAEYFKGENRAMVMCWVEDVSPLKSQNILKEQSSTLWIISRIIASGRVFPPPMISKGYYNGS